MAEIVRAGIISVDEGQNEAASALGMTRLQTMRRIVLPQAMRVIIPPTGNETISMLKTTSLVSVIAYAELLYSVAAHLLGQLRDDPAADRREPLVPDRDDRALDRAVLPRAPLRPRLVARPAAIRPLQRLRAQPHVDPARTDERADGQGRGRAQALRPARGAEGHLARGAARRGDVHPRAVGLRQVDVPPLHQPPREDRRRPALGRRRARRLPPVRRQALRAARLARSAASAPRSAWSSSASTSSRT